jgi:LDH2 family malate/lactate/ureidoglycolate dehydrogenase
LPTIAYENAKLLLCTLLEAAGTPEDIAETVTSSLLEANLTGHDSHGVIRVIQYLDQVSTGALMPETRPVIIRENGATVVIDGAWGWGQLAMRMASEEATRKALEFGIGLGVVERCYHIGRVAPYVELAASKGLIAIAMANAGPAVAPYASRTRVMGTNPIAWAVPRADDPPISLDVATSVVAEGKLRVAKAKGLPSPVGAVINLDGVPSIDPNDFYDGGALMAFAGHKGSGFSILAQLLGRGLAGMTPERLAGHRGGNGPVIIVISPEFIAPLDQFNRAIEDQAETILAAEVAEGFDNVKLPGQPEIEERERRLVNGIDIPETTWFELGALAAGLGVDLRSMGLE